MRFLHTSDFVDFLSPQRRNQVDYSYGLIFFATLVIAIAFCWGLVLLLLKCRSEDTGCAAGHAFKTSYDPTQSSWGDNGSTISGGFDSSLESDSQGRSSAGPPQLRPRFHYGDQLVVNRTRAKRTRIVFLFFGLAAISCVTTFVIFSFARLRDSLNGSEEALVSIQEVFDQVDYSIRSIVSAGDHAESIVATIDLSISSICPNATINEDIAGIDLGSFSDLTKDEFLELKSILAENLTLVNDTLASIQDIKDQVEQSISYTEEYSWVVPGILLGVAVAIILAMLGVVLAWKEKSGRRVQGFMSYGVLPFLIALCLVCWIGTISAGVGAMSSGDACIAGGDPGGPDATIANILERHNLDQNSTAYKMIYGYTNACRIQNPVQELDDLEESIQTAVNNIWREVAKADASGVQNLTELCGRENRVSEFLNGARELAKSLSTMRKGVDSMAGSLGCAIINPIYVELVHNEICNEMAPGLGIAFILLLILSICLMIMISLRAAWLHQIDKDIKVYGDDEIAENMVLDEHEEYLAYISKYKHEWEEYEVYQPGINQRGRSPSEYEDSVESYEDEDEYESEFESSVESSIPDDISFPSLQMTPSIEAAANNGTLAVSTLLPALYPAGSDEEEEAFELGAIQILSPPRNDTIPVVIDASPRNTEDKYAGRFRYAARAAAPTEADDVARIGDDVEIGLFTPDEDSFDTCCDDEQMAMHYGGTLHTNNALKTERNHQEDPPPASAPVREHSPRFRFPSSPLSGMFGGNTSKKADP